MRKLRVLVAMHDVLVPPPDADKLPSSETWTYQMELDVVRTLREIGHDVRVLGIGYELKPVRDSIAEYKPHIVFNILTDFHDVVTYEAHFVSFLELCKQPYTGCNPRGITLAGDKALSKQILAWHRIPCPLFTVFPLRTKIARLPSRMHFPVIVKSAVQHGSAGIAQASVVHDDKELKERVGFLHRTLQTDVVVEAVPRGPRVHGQHTRQRTARSVPDLGALVRQAARGQRGDRDLAREVGRALPETRRLAHGSRARSRQGRRRADLRDLQAHLPRFAPVRLRARRSAQDAEGRVYVIEANVNSDLTPGEDFPESAKHAGLDYGQLLQRILNVGLGYKPAWMIE
jgi:D-alanine-D-alanine ligase